jgi:UrcA family protein
MKLNSTAMIQASVWVVALALTSISLTATAEPAFPSITVRASDLDLASEQGVAVLYWRLRIAADSVCGPSLNTGSRFPPSDYVACVRRALADAVARIDRPKLTAYYARKQGHAPAQPLAAGRRAPPGG